MEHLLLKAATTAADQGTFTAVISTVNPDRDGDIVEPEAMVAALTKWAAIGKLVPLAWVHTDEVVGHIDPASASVKGGEVIAKGFVDQSTPRGEETWRLVKSGTLSFSFGYLFDVQNTAKRAGGGYHIKELDLFEISVVPVAPANNDTRVLSFKSLGEERDELRKRLQEVESQLADAQAEPDLKGKTAEETDEDAERRSVDPLRKQSDQLAIDVAMGRVQAHGSQPPSPKAAPDELRRRSRDLMLQLLSKETTR